MMVKLNLMQAFQAQITRIRRSLASAAPIPRLTVRDPRRRRTADALPIGHVGTLNRYKNYGCRCGACSAVYAAYCAHLKTHPTVGDRRWVRWAQSPNGKKHAAAAGGPPEAA